MKPLRALFVALPLLITAPLFAEKSADEYIADLSSADPIVQIEACRKLGDTGEKKAVSGLIQLLQAAGDERVAAHAAAALGAIGQKGESAQALLRSAESPQPAVRYASVLALAAIGDDEQKEAAAALAGRLAESDQDELVRDIAARLQPIISK